MIVYTKIDMCEVCLNCLSPYCAGAISGPDWCMGQYAERFNCFLLVQDSVEFLMRTMLSNLIPSKGKSIMIKLGAIERKEESKAEKALGLLALAVMELQCAAEAHNVRNQRLLGSIAARKNVLATLVAKYRTGKSNEVVTYNKAQVELDQCAKIMERISVL